MHGQQNIKTLPSVFTDESLLHVRRSPKIQRFSFCMKSV